MRNVRVSLARFKKGAGGDENVQPLLYIPVCL
jgi:hypothetical protein